ncbi:hypothetical protein Anapl_01119 [Anas platyrhynchos]|uniref:Uncharacterized protein n=1 Tax=Anas platyrhynchos TaxID=8839 RepID=R0L2K2_ANAPL|nr:hypothetical protein Anapl_01119 [Anas platyrhynchos]
MPNLCNDLQAEEVTGSLLSGPALNPQYVALSVTGSPAGTSFMQFGIATASSRDVLMWYGCNGVLEKVCLSVKHLRTDEALPKASSVATPGSSCLLRKAMCGCLILGTGHVTFHLPTCTAAAQTVSNLSTRSEVGCLQLQSYISRQHVIHGDDRTCTFRYSEEASESSDLVALICSLLCAVLDLGKPIGSHLFVYPWSHGYSSKGEEFCESDFKKSTVAGPEEKNTSVNFERIVSTLHRVVSEHHNF